MEKLIDYLKQLELSELEAKLYLTLLQTGPTSVRELAAIVDVKRTTTYLYIDQLVEKGLVLKLVRGSKKLIAANEPSSLKTLVDKKIASAKVVERNFSEIVNLLTTHEQSPNENIKTEIRYYKGITGIAKVYEEALKSSDLRLYVNLEELDKLFMPNKLGIDYNMFDRAMSKNPNLRIYEILTHKEKVIEQFSLENTAKNHQYLYKFMPTNFDLTSPGILIYNNHVATITSKGGLQAVVLSDEEYYMNSRKLFEFIWSMLPNPK